MYNAPTVTLTEPADGTKYVSGTGFYLLAKATADTTANPENEVTIQYYRNGQPTNTSKQTVGDGEYTYYAVATDSNGLSTQSEPVTVTVGEGGNVIREFYKENLRNGILRLQTSNITYRSADQNAQPNPAGEGPIPIQIEAKDTNSLMFRVYDNANLLQKENAPFKDIGALTFSIYLDNEGDQSYLDGWNIALMSHAASGNDLVYSYLPLKNYLNGQSAFKQWVDVSIPFTDFENGTFYSGTGDAITPAEGTAFNWDWLFGAGFICTPTAAGEKFYLNDVQFQTKNGGDIPDPQPDYELDEVAFSEDSLAAAKDTGSVTATVKLTNNTNAPLPVSAVVAVFEGDKLAGVKIAPVSSVAAQQQTEIATPEVSVSAEATSVRVFVWNGLGAMVPYGGNAAALK